MKNIIKIAALAAVLVASSAFANTTGIYVGANAGVGKVNESVSINGNKKDAKNGFAYSFDAGYLFNQYVGVELGFNHLNATKFASNVKLQDNYSTDVAVKGIYPFSNNQFNVFGKLGVAYAHTKLKATGVFAGQGSSSSRVVPLFAIGAGYNLTQNIGFNVQLQSTTKSGDVPAMSTLTAGVQYTF